MIAIGIDPGASGAIVVLDGDVVATIKCSETEADIFYFLEAARPHELGERIFALIERVHAMPKQGVSSTFKFGKSLGFLRGLLVALRIPFDDVTPQAWMKAMGCLTKGDKNVTKQKAQMLFPNEKVTHAIADALLIAEFCRRTKG